MLSFKHFAKRFESPVSYGDITEELNKDQKGVVNNWVNAGGGQRAKAISSHVIPTDQDKITVPFGEPAGPAEAHPDVKAHLEKHGYGNITDYRAGLVQDPKYPDKPNRQLKIGGILAKTGASPEVTNAFNNDPNRAASRAASSGLSVTYSRHPHDVAGMSTNQGWASCMTMGGKGQVGHGEPDYDDKARYGDTGGAGVYSHYLKPDVDLGTHVAYLHRSDDPEAKRPLARIALKPFESSTGKATILRPEQRTYGTADDAFGDTVKKWAEKNFPADKNSVYEKNKSLYNDDNRNYVGSAETLYKSPYLEHKRAAFDKNSDASPELIHKGLKDKDIYTAQAAMAHPNAGQEHVDAGINNLNLHASIADRKDLKPEHINKLAKSPDINVIDRLARNSKMAPEDISRLLNNKSARMRQTIAKYQNLTPEQIDTAIKDKDFMVRGAAAANPGASDEHLSKAMKDSPFVAGEALRNSNIKASHLMDYFDRKDRANTNNDSMVMNHPLFNSKHLDKAIEWNQPESTRKRAMEHEKITPEQLQKMADSDPDKKIRERAGRFLKAGKKNGKFPTEAPKGGAISPETMQRINRQDEIRRMENAAEFGRRRR